MNSNLDLNPLTRRNVITFGEGLRNIYCFDNEFVGTKNSFFTEEQVYRNLHIEPIKTEAQCHVQQTCIS